MHVQQEAQALPRQEIRDPAIHMIFGAAHRFVGVAYRFVCAIVNIMPLLCCMLFRGLQS